METSLAARRPFAVVGAEEAGRVMRAVSSVFDILCLWRERAWQRRQLARLSDHMLTDIGISRAEAWMECDKPFWKG